MLLILLSNPVAGRICLDGQSTFKFVLGQDLKGLRMMALVGESTGRKTFLEPNIRGRKHFHSPVALDKEIGKYRIKN